MDLQRDDSEIKFRNKNINSKSYLKYAAAFSVSITTAGLGMIFSWTSPALPHLTSTSSTFPVSEIQGAWVASIVGAGTISGFLINPILINRLGSKYTLLFWAMPQILSWSIVYLGKNWLLLCAARIIGGIGYGGGMCSTTIYLSEVGDESTRGIFLTLVKMSINIGIFITMFFGAFLSYDAMNLALLCIPVIFVITFFSMPDAKQFGGPEDLEDFEDEKLIDKGYNDGEKMLGHGYDQKGVVPDVQGSLENGHYLIKNDRGSDKHSNGVMDKTNGLKRSSNGLQKHPCHFGKNSNGVSKSVNGLKKSTDALKKTTDVIKTTTDVLEKSADVLKESENAPNEKQNGLIKRETDLLESKNDHKEKTIGVVKEDTVVLLQNNTIVVVNEDIVDVIESKSIEFLNENTSCLLEENSLNFLKEYSGPTVILPVENGTKSAASATGSTKILSPGNETNNLTNAPASTTLLPVKNGLKNLTKSKETFEEEIIKLLPSSSERKSHKSVWWKFLCLKNNRMALLIILAASLTDIFSGHMVIVSYTQQIFEYSGASLKPEYAALILAVLKIAASCISAMLVEHCGRRNLFLITGILAGISQGFVGSFFFLKLYLKMDVSAVTWLPLFGVSMYEVVGSVGLSSLYYVYQGELFSNDVKGLGVTCTNIFYEIITFFLKLYFQMVIDAFGIYSVFWGFAICCVVLSFITYWIAPETKGKSKEEIQKLLGG